MLISGCSSNGASETANKNTENSLQELSESITDMVDVKTVASQDKKQIDKQLLNENNTSVTQKGNLFAQQETVKMTGVPLVTLDDYKKAIDFMQRKDWQSADSLFDHIIVEQPQLSGSYVNKALIAKARQKILVAHQYVDKAISVNELNPYAHHLKGQLLKRDGDFYNAEQSYLKALSIWPDYTEVHLSMAVLLELYRGRLLEAYSHYQSYMVLQPNDMQVQRWFAGLKIKLKRAGLTPPLAMTKLTNIEHGG